MGRGPSAVTPATPHAVTAKIADVLTEVLIRHAHHSAPITEAAKGMARDAFLEGLETTHRDMVRPFLKAVLDGDTLPDELRPMLERLAHPTQQWESLALSFLVYGVGFSVASTAMTPFLQSTLNRLWETFPEKPLDPPVLADLVLRGFITETQGAASARQSGMNGDLFASLVDATGDAPSLQLLYDGIRRGVIGDAELEKGIREGRIRDEWIPFIKQLRYVLPSPADFVAAAVEQQMPHDEAAQWAHTAGLAPPGGAGNYPDFFTLLVNTRGRPPGPGELGEMMHRGIIPADGTGPGVLSFAQGIAESDVKTKWTDALQRLAEYLPPPRTITALLREGAISESQASSLFRKAGLSSELADAYVSSATHQKIAPEKELAKGEVLSLYKARAIDTATALGLLSSLGYHGTVAEFILEVADLQLERQYLSAAIGKIRTLYVGLKIDRAAAEAALRQLQLPDGQVAQLFLTWDVELGAEVKLLTAAEVVDAVYYKIIDQPSALAYLVALGYTPFDAWVRLSVRMHGPQPGQPPAEPPQQRPEVGF